MKSGYSSVIHQRKQWLRPGQPAQPVVSSGRFEKEVMLCVWWNFEGPVYWELVPDGRAIDAHLYSQQLQHVYESLRHRYPALINRKRVLLQHDNAPAHWSHLVQQTLAELQGIEVLPHLAYSPDIASSDYHLFHSMSHFLHGKLFTSVDVKNGISEFFASKPPEWYHHGIQDLASRWLAFIQNNELYF